MDEKRKILKGNYCSRCESYVRHKLKGPLEIGSLTNMVLKLLTLWKVYGENMPKLVSFLLGKLDKKNLRERETFCSEFEIFVRKKSTLFENDPKSFIFTTHSILKYFDFHSKNASILDGTFVWFSKTVKVTNLAGFWLVKPR